MAPDEKDVTTAEEPVSEAPVPEEPKVEAPPASPPGYAILDLHLNQFLSFIAEDYSFLPCAVYRPRIDVYLNGRLVYKSRVVGHEDDVFGNVVRLRIHSPNTVVTLKLYECVQLRLTEHCVDELIRPVLKNEPMDEVLLSWCDIEVGLLLPFRQYDLVCAFRVNPMFQHYNPGGILYYPTYKGRAFVDNRRVCCACRVCAFLASHTPTVHKKMLNKYFDFRCDPRKMDVPRRPAVEVVGAGGGAVGDSDTDPQDKHNGVNGTKDVYGTTTEKDASDPDALVSDSGAPEESLQPEPVLAPAPNKDYSEELSDVDIPPEEEKVETFEMNVKKVFFTQDGCTCCRLAEVPRQLRGINYSPCLCCHDYQVCCEHSLETYYYASVSLKLVSRGSIDFQTELLALMNNPIQLGPGATQQNNSLCSIVTRAYELYAALSMIHKHLGFSTTHMAQRKYFYLFVVLILIGFIFDGKTLTVSCFILAILTLYLRTTSTNQFQRDFGDVLQASQRLTSSGQGLERVIRDMIEEDESSKIEEPVNQFQRNLKYIPKHDFVDEVKIFSKLNTSLNRCENIAIKTLTNFLSSSVPGRMRRTLMGLLDFFDGVVWYLNSMLAIIRWYGLPISVFFASLGVLSLRYVFAIKCFIKTLLILVATSTLVEEHPYVRMRLVQLKHLAKYLTMRVRRREWFLNVNSFP